MFRIKWGGSLTRYIVVGVVLVLAVGGGAYYVQSRGNQVRQTAATELAAKQAKQLAADQKTAENVNDSTVAVVKTSISTPSSSSATSTTTTTPNSTTATTSSATELPHTGVAFSASEYLGIGLLVATILSYASSRRQLLRIL